MDLKQEIERRRTFAIISHPDAGKTPHLPLYLHTPAHNHKISNRHIDHTHPS